MEGEKARCCYVNCKKLFKNLDFLTKHLRSKHEAFAKEGLVRISQPYMKSRYDAEPLANKPLPPVRMETKNGIEIRPIKDIAEAMTSGKDSTSYDMTTNRRSYNSYGNGRFNQNNSSDYPRQEWDPNSAPHANHLKRDYPDRNTSGYGKRSRDDMDQNRGSSDYSAGENRRWSAESYSSNKRSLGDEESPKPALTKTPIARVNASYVDLDAPKVMFHLCFTLVYPRPYHHNQVRMPSLVSKTYPYFAYVTFVVH